MKSTAGAIRTPPKGPNWRDDWSAAGVLSSSAAQRRAVFERDKGVCAGCGQPTTKFEADHVRPLHNITPSQRADYPACLWFWSIKNLQTLGSAPCRCHQEKTIKERRANAKTLRLIKKSTSLTVEKINIRPPRPQTKWIGRKPREKKFKPRLAKHIDWL